MKVPLITALTDPAAYRSPVAAVEVIETHISWVLLAGEHAFKLKKPVVLPFADFGSLAARRHYCEEEVRLNRRLAPQVYLGVVPITGSEESPHVEGDGAAIEYAVKMRRFEQDALFSRLLARDALRPELVDRLADRIAAFHASAPAATAPDFGTPDRVLRVALDNFSEMAPGAGAARGATLARLEAWTRESFARLEPAFASRRRDGRVRECHGDLHLGNVALIDGEPVPFDCIEFNAALRWLDVIDEVAFLVMDLLDRGRPDLGYRFLDRYLAGTGDYAGVTVLRFYIVYRALVRAKVHGLRARQAAANAAEARRLGAAADHYLALASRVAMETEPVLVLMHGFSGAGKSRVAAALAAALGAIRVRADVERKRLFGLAGTERSHSTLDAGIYGHEASRRTYARLGDLADTILKAGYPAILDAAFLSRWQRDQMFAFAGRAGVAIWIVDCTADAGVLRDRVAARSTRGGDPSEATVAVLEHQMSTQDPLSAAEQARVVHCDMQGSEADRVAACVAGVLRRVDAG